MSRHARIAIVVLSAALMLLIQACASSSSSSSPTAPAVAPATATKPPAVTPTTAAVASPTVAAAATKAATTTGAATTPAAASAGDPVKGKTVFDTNCNACHPGGQKGVGPAIAGDLAAAVTKQVRSGSSAAIPMPAFPASQITDQQLSDLAAYVGSLK